MIGRIVAVEERYLGSVLSASTVGGESTISVDDLSDFDDAGTLVIDTEADEDGPEYLSWTEVDDDSGDITIDGTVAGTYSAGASVLLYPLSIERWATIISGDNAENEEGIQARVPHSLYDRIPVGIRDLDAGEGETVSAEFISDELVIQDVTGQAPVVDGTYIDPGTIPASSVATDGDPPSSSPTPTVYDGPSFVAVRWTAITNADPVTYEVHISTANGFTPDSSTLYAETPATGIVIKTLQDGTALTLGTTYYVKLIAKDADGSAAASSQDSGVLVSIPSTSLTTDGNPPSSSPTAVVKAGPSLLSISWTPITNNDPVTYEVHLSTSTGFTPGSGTTLLGTTAGTSWVTTVDHSGTALTNGVTYYVKIIAKDADGSASAGTQGSAAPYNLPSNAQTSDGAAPGSSPTPTVKGGPKLLSISWDPVSNNDLVSYEVHLSTSTGFTPGSGTTLVGTTTGTSFVATVDHGGSALVYGTTYYCKIIAKDVDGSAAASSQGSGSMSSIAVTTDGSAPSSSPTPTIVAGLNYFAATWTAVSNADAVTYEVHVAPYSGFTPNTGTKYGEVNDNVTMVKRLPVAYGTYAQYNPAPISFIRLGDSSGTTAVDTMGNQNGTYHNSPTLAVTGPLTGDATTAVTLNGSSQYIDLAYKANLHPGDTFTIMGWFKRAASGVVHYMFHNGSNDVSIRLDASDRLVLRKSSVADIFTSTPTYADTNWHHFAFSKTGATLISMVDGASIAGTFSNQTIVASGSSSTFIGSTNTPDQYFNGTLANFLVFNVALSAAQIAAHYDFVDGLSFTYGNTYYFKTVAKDADGSASASSEASSTIVQVAAIDITAASITSSLIASNTIVAGNIAASTITGSKIAANTITASNITAATITTTEIASSTIVAGNIAASTITGAKIAAGTITATNIAAGTITATEIAAATITGAKIAATTITASNIAAGTITATEIAAATITGAKIAATTITASNIAAGTITATEIAAATITGAKIAAGTITASNIVADTITANEIAASAITASEIAASAVTAEKLESSLVLSTTIIAGTVGAARIELGTAGGGTGVTAYASDGTTIKFSVDADTGDLYAAGRLDFGTASRLDSDIIDIKELPSSGYQTPAIVQDIGDVDGPVSTSQIFWNQATTAGNELILAVTVFDTDGTAPSISTPSGWTLITSTTQNGIAQFIYRATSSASRSGAESITLNDTVYVSMKLLELSGVQAAAADKTAIDKSGTGSTSPASGSTATTSQTDEILLGVLGYKVTNAAGFPIVISGETSGFTAASITSSQVYDSGSNTGVGQRLYWKNVTATGTYSFGATLPTSWPWACAIITLKAKTVAIDAPAADKLRIYAVDDGHASTGNDCATLVMQSELGIEKSLEYPGLRRFHDSTAPPFIYLYSDCNESSSGIVNLAPAANGLVADRTGTGSDTSGVSVSGHPGILRVSTGTTSSGESQIRGGTNSYPLGSGRMRMGSLVRVPTLSNNDATNTFVAAVGFKDFSGSLNSIGTAGNAVIVRYSHSINSGKWQVAYSNGSSSSTADTGVAAVTANTWYWIEIDISADGTEAKVYINGSLTNTVSGANFPAVGAALNHHPAAILKTASTTSRNFDCDFYYCYVETGTRPS